LAIKDAEGATGEVRVLVKYPEFVAKFPKKGHRKAIQHEVQMMSKLHGCPQLMTYSYLWKNLDTNDNIPIMQRASFDMITLVNKITNMVFKMPIRQKATILKDLITEITFSLLRGLMYMETQCIVHRDIKPDNVLVLPDGELAICDFGMAEEVANYPWVRGFKGTRGYVAPEVGMNNRYIDGHAADMFSLGKSLMACCDTWGLLPPDYVMQMCSHDPQDRPTATSVHALLIRTWEKIPRHIQNIVNAP
jgi:serine/threonine protein kinase